MSPTEDCLSWIPIVEQYPHCGYLTDCSGLTCLTNYGYIHTATVSVEKCVDPVRAELTLESGGDVLFQRNFTESEDVDEGYRVLVDMQRNNTHLQFSVSLCTLVQCHGNAAPHNNGHILQLP